MRKRVYYVFWATQILKNSSINEWICNTIKQSKNLFILEIYPASEENITGISSETLIDEINLRGGNASFVKFNEIDNIIINSNKTIRAILMQGAGNISAKTKQLIHEIQS